jgi:hypothetical protein
MERAHHAFDLGAPSSKIFENQKWRVWGSTWIAAAALKSLTKSDFARKRRGLAAVQHLEAERSVESNGAQHVAGGKRNGTDRLDHDDNPADPVLDRN